MPYLQKIQRVNGKEKKAAPPQPLAPIIESTLGHIQAIQPPAAADGEATIEVHDAVSNVAWVYEKLRQVIDYQDEHLLRKNAIERILKRRLTGGVTAEEVAEPLILELIRGRYLPNSMLPASMITATTEVINAYIHLWLKIPTSPDQKEQEKTFDWYIGIMSVQLAELLSPVEREESLAQLMFDVTHRDIRFADESIDEQTKNTLLYIAIRRALLKSDTNILRYRLFIKFYPQWLHPTPEMIAELGPLMPHARQAIDAYILHPAGELLQRIMKKYVIIFHVFDDMVEQFGSTAAEQLTLPDTVNDTVKTVYNSRRKTVVSRITRNIIRSFTYILITKMFLVLLLEVPINRLLTGSNAIHWIPIAISIGVPPLILLLIGVTIRAPGKKNEQAVAEKVRDLLYQGDKAHAIVTPRKPFRRSSFFTALYRFVYSLAFIIVFGAIVIGLSQFSFSYFDMFIFLLFLTLVSFFGIRIRLLAKELLVVDQREGVFNVIFDFFTLPIVQVGRWISLRAPKVNVMIFFLDVIIEAPFKAFLEAVEGFFGFMREKREEIY